MPLHIENLRAKHQGNQTSFLRQIICSILLRHNSLLLLLQRTIKGPTPKWSKEYSIVPFVLLCTAAFAWGSKVHYYTPLCIFQEIQHKHVVVMTGIANTKAAATLKEMCHYHNSGGLVALSWANYQELHSWHPTATTGKKMFLIKAIEPLRCARFSEEHSVILRQTAIEDGLQIC